MEKLVVAMGPLFAAGLGIQQLMEILDPILDKIASNHKKVLLGVISLGAGLALAFGAGLHVLQDLGSLGAKEHETLDALLSGVIISGGTEGINSILKFLKYKKEETKNDAANTVPGAAAASATGLPGASAPAIDAMNRK